MTHNSLFFLRCQIALIFASKAFASFLLVFGDQIDSFFKTFCLTINCRHIYNKIKIVLVFTAFLDVIQIYNLIQLETRITTRFDKMILRFC